MGIWWRLPPLHHLGHFKVSLILSLQVHNIFTDYLMQRKGRFKGFSLAFSTLPLDSQATLLNRYGYPFWLYIEVRRMITDASQTRGPTTNWLLTRIPGSPMPPFWQGNHNLSLGFWLPMLPRTCAKHSLMVLLFPLAIIWILSSSEFDYLYVFYLWNVFLPLEWKLHEAWDLFFILFPKLCILLDT